MIQPRAPIGSSRLAFRQSAKLNAERNPNPGSN